MQACDNTTLLNEYLEIIIQFGMLMLFGATFPLAPLLVFLNNILEVIHTTNTYFVKHFKMKRL